MELRIGKHYFMCKYYKLVDNIEGIRSICSDNQHILFMDLDKYDMQELNKKVSELQQEYDVGSLYLFESSKGSYHLVSFNKFTYGECIDIMKFFDWGCLKKYCLFSIKRNSWVLRFTGKYQKEAPQFVKKYSKKNTSRQQSSAHEKFFRLNYDVNNIDMPNPDNTFGLVIDTYSTTKSGATCP